MAVTDDILRSYIAPRVVLRKLLDQHPGEGRALAWLIGGCVLIFIAQWPRLVREAHLNDEIPLMGLVSGALFGWLFLMPLILFGVAALVHFLSRLFGMRTTMATARVVTFWSLLAISPLWLVQGLVTGIWGVGVAAGIVIVLIVAGQVLLIVAGMREAALEPPEASA